MLGWLVKGLVALAVLVAAGLVTLDSSLGHRFIADQIAGLRPANGLRYSVGRINGSVFSHATLIDVRIRDPKGLVFRAPRAELYWSPLAWLSNRLDISRLELPSASLVKLPETVPSTRSGPILPGFDIHVGALTIDRLMVGQRVTGVARTGRVAGLADVRGGRALVKLRAVVAGSDTVRLILDAAPDQDRFDVDVEAHGRAGGVLAQLAGQKKAVDLAVSGDGRWQRWRGSAQAMVGGARVADLALGNQGGQYTLRGAVMPAAMIGAKLARLASPRVTITGAASFADRQLEGALALRSSALAIDLTGAADLAKSRYRDVRLRIELLQPPALLSKMVGRRVELRMILDGAFATAAFDYRLTADFVSFGKEGFEQVRAGGQGRLSRQPVTVPLRLTVNRVTGVDAVAGAILRNLVVDGALKVTAKLITGTALKFRSDKLTGSLNLSVDLANGRYDVALTGALGRYLIPGLGIVDVTSRLNVVPDPNGKGARIIGTGTAQMVRLDNRFFASLAGGLPHMETQLEQSTDGVLHFHKLVLTAPDIRITGEGFHRRDGSFYFEGTGTQRQYGPLTIKLDGRIERPTLDLTFARPNDTTGLRDVIVHLDPTAAGFALTARGGSVLGAFEGNGQLLLPKGAEATLIVAALDAGGIKAHGTLKSVPGGFDGRLDVGGGGGVAGTIDFAPAPGAGGSASAAVQRIEAHLDAREARVLGDATLRRGHLDLVTVLYPEGATVEASGEGRGLRRGTLGLARFSGKLSLRNGSGKAHLAMSGSRGRSFDISADADVSPDSYRITGAGVVDRRPLKLLEPALVTREGSAWRLAPTTLSFAGGKAEIGGQFAPAATTIDATLAQMPLSIIDIAYPGLGLSGSASGKLRFADGVGRAPTGSIDMTVRGLSRSGLVLSSQPIDVGIAAQLAADSGAVRAVMASGGKTIGRAQARLSPLGGGTLAERLLNAQLFAQVRYNGPADTLWRLTGIELFDLSGPVAIGADFGGKVNDPLIRGVVRSTGARIESATTGTVLTGVAASGRFTGSKLVIDSFAADAGKGGRVSATGSFDFAAVHGFGIDLALLADNAVMINRDDIGATVTGPLTFKSDGSGGVIGGDVKLVRSRYRLGQAVAASAVPKLNVREINLPGGDEIDDRSPDKPWALDVHARADDQLAVSGLGLSSMWSADLTIRGAIDNPAITGRADIVRGSYEFSGRDFAIERGIIRFEGELPANPSLDISANADTTGLTASIRVTGPANKPEISFASTPALPQDELLSRLLFGASITQLSAPEALQLAAAVASLQGKGGGLNPINALRRVAGLDRLRILPADTTVGRSTAVAAGKYITRKLYAEIITDGQGYSATQVEFRVTRWLSILSTISTLGRQSANVRVSKDY
ncbi:MAG: hypothetical protein B7Y45_11365 [Sphingomonas sp. 28-66-16]|nr:MAG: hypothetical protein B7Y45_11365 [Sphingomonas sp. 28-66-16]